MKTKEIANKHKVNIDNFELFLKNNKLPHCTYKHGGYIIDDEYVEEYVKQYRVWIKNGGKNGTFVPLFNMITVLEVTQKHNIDYEEFMFFLNEEGLKYIDGNNSKRFIKEEQEDEYVNLFMTKAPIVKEKLQIAKQKAEEQKKQELKKAEEEKQARISRLALHGLNGYYEYKVISLVDDKGSLNINKLETLLNTLGMEGWHVVGSYANELGHNSFSGGVLGLSAGTNSTVDQNVIILERFVLM